MAVGGVVSDEVTVKATFAVLVWLIPGALALTTRLLVPVGVEAVVVIVTVDEPEPVTEVGLKLAVAFAGSPLMLKLTVPSNPPKEPTLTVKLVELPCCTLKEEAEAEREN